MFNESYIFMNCKKKNFHLLYVHSKKEGSLHTHTHIEQYRPK